MPKAVPPVSQEVEGVAAVGCIKTCGKVVVPLPPVNAAPVKIAPGLDAAPADENITLPLKVPAPRVLLVEPEAIEVLKIVGAENPPPLELVTNILPAPSVVTYMS